MKLSISYLRKVCLKRPKLLISPKKKERKEVIYPPLGTIDAFLSTFQDETGESAPLLAMLTEVNRVLKPGGVYLALCGNAPFLVFPYLQRDELDWNVECIPVEKNRSRKGGVFSTYYLYVMHKSA